MMVSLRILVAVFALGLSSAHAGPITDLSTPQTGDLPSMLDLSGGRRAARGGTDSAESPGSVPAGTTAETRAKTQHVSGYTRKDGTYVRSYVRAPRR
jgi:hypothetical protein